MRYTNMANAFLRATIKEVEAGKVDHKRGTGHFVARRIAIAVENGSRLGLTSDARRVQRDAEVATAIGKVLDPKTQAIIEEEIFHVCDQLVAGRKVGLMDEEILGID